MGTYAESLLTPDERVLRRERQHPIALVLDSWMAIILWGITLLLIIARIIVPEEIFGQRLFGDDTWLARWPWPPRSSPCSAASSSWLFAGGGGARRSSSSPTTAWCWPGV